MTVTQNDNVIDEPFDEINQLLNDALRKIEKNLSLSTSVTELARQAKIHRNTIYLRKWPLKKLATIKSNRTQQKKEQALLKASGVTPENLLEQSRLEIIYWFTQLQDARLSNKTLLKEKIDIEKSRNFYMELANKRLESINQNRIEIQKLQDALALLEEELSQLKC